MVIGFIPSKKLIILYKALKTIFLFNVFNNCIVNYIYIFKVIKLTNY